MPLVASHDPGNRDGMVHSHRFAAANTAIASSITTTINCSVTEEFPQSGFITVDLFAATPVEAAEGTSRDAAARRGQPGPGVHLRGRRRSGADRARRASAKWAKLPRRIDAPGVRFQPGSTVRVDAVVRTRKIGHFFPAGTVDAFDVWLEFKAATREGRMLAWSGRVEDNGRGPVEKGAHFYRSYQLDGGRQPDQQAQRLADAQRALCAADSARRGRYGAFPRADSQDAEGPITLEAQAELPQILATTTPSSRSPAWPSPGRAGVSDSTAANTPSTPQPVPDLPIVTLAAATTVSRSWASRIGSPVLRKQDRERWNDWGIGLLLQGDLKGAEYAFRRVTEAEPGYADGWLNVARALIQEGETDAARPFVEKALALEPHAGARPLLPGHGPESRRRLRWRAQAACRDGAISIRATAWR